MPAGTSSHLRASAKSKSWWVWAASRPILHGRLLTLAPILVRISRRDLIIKDPTHCDVQRQSSNKFFERCLRLCSPYSQECAKPEFKLDQIHPKNLDSSASPNSQPLHARGVPCKNTKLKRHGWKKWLKASNWNNFGSTGSVFKPFQLGSSYMTRRCQQKKPTKKNPELAWGGHQLLHVSHLLLLVGH